MQAIQTKWIPATYTRPNRIKAFCAAGSITMGADSTPYASHTEEAHKHVARHLADKLKWTGELIGASTKQGFVFIELNKEMSLLHSLTNLKSPLSSIEIINSIAVSMAGTKSGELNLTYNNDGSITIRENK